MGSPVRFQPKNIAEEVGFWNAKEESGNKGFGSTVRDEEDFIRHIDYIHYNPEKHGYVEKASQWEYSSIHRYIQKGIIDKEWDVALGFQFKEKFGEAWNMGCWASFLASGAYFWQLNLRAYDLNNNMELSRIWKI